MTNYLSKTSPALQKKRKELQTLEKLHNLKKGSSLAERNKLRAEIKELEGDIYTKIERELDDMDIQAREDLKLSVALQEDARN